MSDFGAIFMAWCAGCEHGTSSVEGACGHLRCASCGRCPPCDGPIEVEMEQE